MIRFATAKWLGSGKEGNGTLSAPGGVLKDTPYSFNTRFGDTPGTNPEELIAAAHAGCFSMKLSFVLGSKGFTPSSILTRAELNFEGGAITGIHLITEAQVPGMSAEDFLLAATEAKENCPVSKALSALNITMEARLA